ncbi:MAG: response regulator transcription factor [Clostridiales bacterium]|nr:response regulator transcription factor [Clostridiales bacterium]
MSKILIVEDDDEIAMLEKDYLEISGYETEIIQDGKKAKEAAMTGDYDLILLDIMLPGVSGYEICREIREKINIPILMVTAKTESVDKIRGLGLGADDYISKPFDPAELVARVSSHLSRYKRLCGSNPAEANADISGKSVETTKNEMIQIGDLQIMVRGYKAWKKDREIKFPNREFELLKFLAMNPNIVFSKEQLFEKIWGYDYIGDSATVTVHVNRIREKIEDDPGNPKIIETVWGVGYRLSLSTK